MQSFFYWRQFARDGKISFLEKKENKYFKMSPAEILPSALSVKLELVEKRL